MSNDSNTMSILGQLICRVNPYTGNPKPGVQGWSGLTTGDMIVGTPPPGGEAKSDPTVAVEVQANYPGAWIFKGQEQNINTAIRIPYRFPVLDNDGIALYWVTEYLLIGFVGAGGGG